MNDDLILDLDLNDIPEESLQSRGGMVTVPGAYHFVIDDVAYEAPPGKTPNLKFTCLITAGDQQGRCHIHRLWISPKQWNREKQGQWAKCLCLPVSASQTNRINWAKAIGRHFCANLTKRPIETNPDTGEQYPERLEIPYAEIFKPTDKSFANVPKDPRIMATYNAETDEFVASEVAGVADAF